MNDNTRKKARRTIKSKYNEKDEIKHINDLDCHCEDCQDERNDYLQQYYNEL